MLEELNNHQIDQYSVSAYSSRSTDHERWVAIRIAKLNLCQLNAPKTSGLKKEDFQDCLDSENNDNNECGYETSQKHYSRHARCIDIENLCLFGIVYRVRP